MNDSGPVEPIASRFITRAEQVRADRTLKPDAFIPPESLELSVTMLNGDPARIWIRGLAVIAERVRTLPSCRLIGRGDIRVNSLRECRPLTIRPDPTPDDPHHAIIVDWPPEKAGRKVLAIQLSQQASFIPCAA